MCCSADTCERRDHARIQEGNGIFSPTMEGMLCYAAWAEPTPTHEEMLDMIRALIDHGHMKPREVDRLIDAGYVELRD
jgi:hypothetical protein